MPTAPADRFTLWPRIATTKPPAPKSSPTRQQILPNSSFSMPSCLSLCTVPSCSISCFLSSGPFSCSGPDISFSSRARSGSDPGWRSSSEPYRFLWAWSWWRVSLLFWSSRAKASPENAKIGVTPVRHPMGTTTQHPRLLPLPQRTTRVLPFGLYPDNANKTRLTTTVKGTLNRTLTKSQKSTLFPCRLAAFRAVSRDPGRTLGVHLRLEEDLFQYRFEVAHDFLLSLRA